MNFRSHTPYDRRYQIMEAEYESITLLQGTCAFRTVPAGFRLTDTAAALRFAKECGGMLKTAESLDAEAYRCAADHALEVYGEQFPGMESVPEREAFSVRFGKTD